MDQELEQQYEEEEFEFFLMGTDFSRPPHPNPIQNPNPNLNPNLMPNPNPIFFTCNA